MLMKSLQYYLCGLLLLLAGSMQAQNGSGFDPSNPAEPTVPVFKYSLTVAVSPSGAGTASGAGSYAPGTTTKISTSANANYTFSHWTLNGERIEAAKSFSYTTIEGPMNFVAVYDYTPAPFTPTNPAEPSMNVKSRLYLTSDPTGICTFNRTSGDYVTPDAYVTVDVTNVNQGYEFAGWYQDGDSGQKDYYISFAIHFYSLFYVRVMNEEDPERCEIYKERAMLFAKEFIYWFDESGASLPYGRSLTYRFSQVSFFSACLMAGIEPFPVGVIKG